MANREKCHVPYIAHHMGQCNKNIVAKLRFGNHAMLPYNFNNEHSHCQKPKWFNIMWRHLSWFNRQQLYPWHTDTIESVSMRCMCVNYHYRHHWFTSVLFMNNNIQAISIATRCLPTFFTLRLCRLMPSVYMLSRWYQYGIYMRQILKIYIMWGAFSFFYSFWSHHCRRKKGREE